jgi:hypothetical protein
MSACWGFSRTFDNNALQPAITSGRIFGLTLPLQD